MYTNDANEKNSLFQSVQSAGADSKCYIVRGYECYCDSNNIHIVDSYKVKDIDGFLDDLIKTVGKDFKYQRGKKAWSAEWYAHNLAYKMGVMRAHSKDVDLNDDETLVKRVIYHIVKPIARVVC